ncbi:MAG: isocitrate lyase/PEP mutase family protein [Gammaproteobacteria bacterium]
MTDNSIQNILKQVGSLAFPGIYDTLSAKIAEQVGFPMGFISGYSLAATTIGEPDFGLLTQTEVVERARAICNSVSIPIIVDADTGYGNPLNVHRTVTQLIDAGAKGCFLEDQVWPKKCGHMRNKKVIDREDYLYKIQAAVDARGDDDFFIVARTDAEAVLGLDEAIARVKAARELGANASFVEAPGSLEQLKKIGQESPHPNVANMIEGGATPVLPKSTLEELGFHLILYPLTGLFAAGKTLRDFYSKLNQDGTTLGLENDLLNFEEFNELIGVEEKYKQSEKYGVK